MAIQDGVFATRHASGIASVANGGVQRNTSNPCEGPLTSFSPLDIVVPPIDFLIKEKSQNDARFNICGYDTIYIKAIFKNHPNSFSCPNSSIEATSNTIKVLIHCPDVKIIGDTPLCVNSTNRFEAKPLYNLPLGSKSYQWQNGSNDTFLNVSQPTILKLVYQKENCKDSALLNVRNNNKISKEIDINIDYNDFSNFIHFSSAQTRLENFYAKAELIEQARIRKQLALEKALEEKRAAEAAYAAQLQADEERQFEQQTEHLAALRHHIDQEIADQTERYQVNPEQPSIDYAQAQHMVIKDEQIQSELESVRVRLELEAESMIEQAVTVFRAKLHAIAQDEIEYILKNSQFSDKE
jgi:hypothetical protein